MKINWYSFTLKREQTIDGIYKDFKEYIEDYDALMKGNSIWGYGSIEELSEPLHIYYCSINSEVSQGLTQIFLSKYNTILCKKPNSNKVGHVCGDVEALTYE